MVTTKTALPILASSEFINAVQAAIQEAQGSDDECIDYCAQNVPTYVQYQPTPQQSRAGGCRYCTYLGLWTDHWPGYERAPHGLIFLFEDGIRKEIEKKTAQGIYTTLQDECLRVFLHEVDHALQRDHVLEGMRQQGINARP